jgi:hypothetical protein
MSAAKNTLFAQWILGDTPLFFELGYALVKAGEVAIQRPDVVTAANDVCVLPINLEGCTRKKAPIDIKLESATPVVQFNTHSLTIVGGSAIQAYTTVKGRNENYVQTTDIDAVWWPNITLPASLKKQLQEKGTLVNSETSSHPYILQSRKPNPNSEKPNAPEKYMFPVPRNEDFDKYLESDHFAVLSSSWAIQSLVQIYVKELEKQLTRLIGLKDNKTKLIGYAKEIYGIENPVITAATKYHNQFALGICSIWGYLVIHEGATHHATIKLIELTIHDGASSQKSTQLEPAIHDIVFSHISEVITYSGKIIRVPTIQRLMDQQLYVLGSRSDERKKTTLHRINFLYKYLKDNPKYTAVINDLCSKGEKILCFKPAALLPTPQKSAIGSIPSLVYPSPPSVHVGYPQTPYMTVGAPEYPSTSSVSMGYPQTPYMTVPSAPSVHVGYHQTPYMTVGAQGYHSTSSVPMGYTQTPYMTVGAQGYSHNNTRKKRGKYNTPPGITLRWVGVTSDGKFDIFEEVNIYGKVVGTTTRPIRSIVRKKRKTRKL